jgi:hypothetical protein
LKTQFPGSRKIFLGGNSVSRLLQNFFWVETQFLGSRKTFSGWKLSFQAPAQLFWLETQFPQQFVIIKKPLQINATVNYHLKN